MTVFLRLFYIFILQPVVLFLGLFVSLFNEKVRVGFTLRRKHKLSSIPKDLNPLWFHCASGEFEYVISIIRKIKETSPTTKILVTYFSPSYVKTIEKNKYVDYSMPLPFDLPGPVSSFLNHVKPKALILARTDLWPEVLYQCKSRGLQRILISKTQRPIKGLSRILNPLRAKLLNSTSHIFAVTESDIKNLKSLGVKTAMQVSGDTRYDQVVHRLNSPTNDFKHQLKPDNDKPTLIIGSSWAEDEKVILPSLINLVNLGDINLIIAPHEPNETHLSDLQLTIKKYQGSYNLYSTGEQFTSGSTLIVDTIGVLAQLYKWSDMAFIGGSFKSQTHSVMEALATGNLVCVGPKNQNNREAQVFKNLRLKENLCAVTEVPNEESFKKWLNTSLNTDLSKSKDLIKQSFNNKAGATKTVYNWLSQQLLP